MRPLGDGRAEVRFALVDTVRQVQLAGMTYVVTPAQFRATAHKIADIVYEKLTGDAGVFSTRIAYITKQGPRFELIVADADGGNPQGVVTSNEPLLSPSWSPDGSRLAYVSLENKKPVVYVQSLATGGRQVLANFRGSNSAPAWSPDGRRLVVTLSKDGGSQLFMINADGTGVTRLLTSPGIDTEASFTPDGQSILFTSDRGGTPQVYRLNLATNARRADDVRGQLQRVAARAAGRQGLRLREARRRPLHARDPGLRDAPGAGADAGPAGRKPERRAEFEAHHLRGAAGRAWYIGRNILRRPREAAARLAGRRRARARVGSASALTLRRRTQPHYPSSRRHHMRKFIIAAIVVVALAGCSSTGTQTAAPVEDRPADTQRRGRRLDQRHVGDAGHRHRGARLDPGAQGSGQHALAEAQRLFRVRRIRRQGRVQGDGRGARQVPAGQQGRSRSRCRATPTSAARASTTSRSRQKRADSVKKLMQLLGATEVQIETVSFGKEKPRREGHDEASWAENRRVDIVYVGE